MLGGLDLRLVGGVRFAGEVHQIDAVAEEALINPGRAGNPVDDPPHRLVDQLFAAFAEDEFDDEAVAQVDQAAVDQPQRFRRQPLVVFAPQRLQASDSTV